MSFMDKFIVSCLNYIILFIAAVISTFIGTTIALLTLQTSPFILSLLISLCLYAISEIKLKPFQRPWLNKLINKKYEETKNNPKTKVR